MRVENVHERTIEAGTDEVGLLLATLGRPGDRVWPTEAWPAMKLDRPLGVGATGGHGPIRYTVTAYEPGGRVVFAFAPGGRLDGTHEFVVEPLGPGPGRCQVRHTISGRLAGTGPLVWPLVMRWLHDALLEDLLDRLERETGRDPVRPARPSAWARLLRAVMFPRRGRRATTPRVRYP